MKIKKLASTVALTVACKDGDWYKATKSLLDEARKQKIFPSVITHTHFTDAGEYAITLWGEL